jgi:hypothetical protein
MNGYADYLPNYTGDPRNCMNCNIQMQNFARIFIVDLYNDGRFVSEFCSEICYQRKVGNVSNIT